MTKEAPLPVIVRYEGKGRADRPDWRLRDLVAVFPSEIGDASDPHSMSCYSPNGEHSACAAGYIGRKTKPATPAQVKAMLRQLRFLGYKNLRVVSRASVTHARSRREAVRKETRR